MTSLEDIHAGLVTLATKLTTLSDTVDTLIIKYPVTTPAVIVYSGSWPARSTATTLSTRRVLWIGNPGGTAPPGMLTNDIWTQGV